MVLTLQVADMVRELSVIKFSNGKISARNILEKWQISLIESQITFIDKLIVDSEGFLEFAHFRRAQLKSKLYHLDNKNTLKEEIKSDYSLLVKDSKRQKGMYQNILNKELF